MKCATIQVALATPTGRCVSWRGTYGFIEPDGDFPNIFVHYTDLVGTRVELEPGDKVSYEVGRGHGKVKAINVQVTDEVRRLWINRFECRHKPSGHTVLHARACECCPNIAGHNCIGHNYWP